MSQTNEIEQDDTASNQKLNYKNKNNIKQETMINTKQDKGLKRNTIDKFYTKQDVVKKCISI